MPSQGDKWVWEEDKNIEFINPYNFISIKDHRCKKKSYEQGDLAGRIECKLTTKTSVIIPNSSNENAFECVTKKGEAAKSYNFFSYNDLSSKNKMVNGKEIKEYKNDPAGYYEPVIPGSEIRGVIRSSYEALTNSCLSTVDHERIIHLRTQVPKTAAFLRKIDKKWYLEDANIVSICIEGKDYFHNEFDEGQVVYYLKKAQKPLSISNITKDEPEDIDNYDYGYLHIGEYIYGKKTEKIFTKKVNPVLREITEEDIRRLEKVLQYYNDTGINELKRKGSHFGYDKFKVQDGALVYYSIFDKYFYISPANITRDIMQNNLNHFLGDFVPCSKKDNLCDACNLFGMVGMDDDSQAIGSRIRFSDAMITEDQRKKVNSNNDYYEVDGVINELSSPRLSSTEFYLEKPFENCDMWNYDYAAKWIDNDKPKVTPLAKVNIKGRKFYWHHKPNFEEPELNKMNCKMRMLKQDGIEFVFYVYYENLKMVELQKLIWTLSIGGRKNNYHKIGRGKPLGFGSIKIDVVNVLQRKIGICNGSLKYSNEIDWDIQKYNTNTEVSNIIDLRSKNVDEFLMITDFNAVCDNKKIQVCYPLGDDGRNKPNSIAGHQWFRGNRGKEKGEMKPTISYPLPYIKKPVGTLYKFIRIKLVQNTKTEHKDIERSNKVIKTNKYQNNNKSINKGFEKLLDFKLEEK